MWVDKKSTLARYQLRCWGVNLPFARVVNCTVPLEKVRPTATIVVPAWNAWTHTRACLNSLRSTIAQTDQIVIVDNGSRDATAKELAKFDQIEVITNRQNRGTASAWNQGAQHAHGEIIIFLHNDTVVGPGWLEVLLAAFDDPTVAASGSATDLESPERFHTSGPASETEVLSGPCLAVRRSVFREIGGFDEHYVMGGYEDWDLCRKMRATGRRLVTSHDVNVSHVGRVTFDANHVDHAYYRAENWRRYQTKWQLDAPDTSCLISVCLIVKDEEAMLESCLESVGRLADEIVVYDTGSTDRTVEIARAGGARVFEGFWDDSFARARNAALGQARGEWVLSLDADETFLGDAQTIRDILRAQPVDVDAFLVPIENLHGAGNARSVHTAVRLFRRSRATWRHRLHEQVVAVDDLGRGLRINYLSGGRIIHSGYVAAVFDSRDKAGRNLDLARAALDDGDMDHAYALMNYGRALESAGRSDEAVDALLDAAAATEDPITHRLAIKNLINILQRLGRFDEALAQVVELRRVSVIQIVADIAEGNIRISMGDVDGGLAILARIPPRGRDDDGMEYSVHTLAALRGTALATLGEYSLAADIVLAAIREVGVLEADLGELTRWLESSSRSPSEIAEAMQESDLMPVLGRVVHQTPEVADAVLEGIWKKFPDHVEPLAAAARLAPRLGIARALVWSSRLRAQGLGTSCPLVTMCADVDADPVVRLLAAAAAYGTFGDRRVVRGAREARAKLPPEIRDDALATAARLAPTLMEQESDDEYVAVEGSTGALAPTQRVERGRRVNAAPTLNVVPHPICGGINVIGPFESSDRHGHVARAVATALRGENYPVSTTSYHAGGRPGVVEWQHRDAGDFPFDTSLFVMSPEDLSNFAIDLGAKPFENRYAIGMWPWDLEQPSEMMTITARMVHEIWVPSAFSARAVSRVTDQTVTNVRVPLDFEGETVRTCTDDRFTFVTGVDYRTGFERQNPLGVVGAYCGAFESGDETRLIIEVAHEHEFPAEHARLLAQINGRDDIVFISKVDGVSGRELVGRTRAATCFVTLHRSEGTGLGLTRAAALGVPIIATRHSIATEILSERDALLVPATPTPIPNEGRWCTPGGTWAEPDLEAATLAMRRLVSTPLRTRLDTGRVRRQVSQLYAPSLWSRSVRDLLRGLEQRRHGVARSVNR